MSNYIDLRKYVVAKWGKWHERKDCFGADELRLTSIEDGIALAGPLCVRVSVMALNHLTTFGTSSVHQSEREAFAYNLELAPGQVWSYPEPRAQRKMIERNLLYIEREATKSHGSTGSTAKEAVKAASPAPTQDVKQSIAKDVNLTAIEEINPNIRAAEIYEALESAGLRLGTNAGFAVYIRLCGPEICYDPCAVDVPRGCGCGRTPCQCQQQSRGCGCGRTPCQCQTQRQGCGCGCTPCQCQPQGNGIPCNFAQRGGPNLNWYFPSACEPCAPGATLVSAPTMTGPALLVRPATGGTVRTRYFNGMFITREDLETDQRNARLKRSLMNRALGQGVAWGFELSMSGNGICVLPGYGVDCCGNDIVLAAPYRVDIDALVQDPAAAAAMASGQAQGMSLILEYYECPEEPRPVHGDPCSTNVTLCETSRIRETARLRLAPPCDVDTSGCIADFLRNIEKLRNTGAVFKAAQAAAKKATPQTSTQYSSVPFQVTVNSPTSGTNTIQLQPTTNASDASDTITLQPVASTTFGVAFTCTSAGSGFTFDTSAKPSVVFTSTNAPTGLITMNVSSTNVGWSFALPATSADYTFELENWQMTDGAGNTYSCPRTTFNLTATLPANSAGSLLVDIPGTSVVTETSSTSEDGGGFPCADEACTGKPRFQVTPPFLHAIPGKPTAAADPGVLLLALLYAFLVVEVAQQGGNVDNVQATPAMKVAAELFLIVKTALFGEDVGSVDRIVLAVQELLDCWCKSLLYPGPKCLCSPHGIVIGCARVDGGRITMVDPWGGRRWIVQYPLLSYWGQQFGIMPFDAFMSRIFDVICCIACLGNREKLWVPRDVGNVKTVHDAFVARVTGAKASAQPAAGGSSSSTSPSGVIPLGSTMLAFDSAQGLAAKLVAMGTQSVNSQTVSVASFAARLWNAASATLTSTTSSTSSTVPVSVTDYVLDGFPDIHLVVPDTTATASSNGSASQGSLDTMLKTAVTSAPAGSTPPPLLRTFASSLAKRLLAVAPLEPTDSVQQNAANALASAGVTTIGELLSRDPESLLKTALKGASADGLNGVVSSAEMTARTVASDVADAVTKFAAQNNVTSRADLTDATRAASLSKALADRLATANVVVTPEIVGHAVKFAASGS